MGTIDDVEETKTSDQSSRGSTIRQLYLQTRWKLLNAYQRYSGINTCEPTEGECSSEELDLRWKLLNAFQRYSGINTCEPTEGECSSKELFSRWKLLNAFQRYSGINTCEPTEGECSSEELDLQKCGYHCQGSGFDKDNSCNCQSDSDYSSEDSAVLITEKVRPNEEGEEVRNQYEVTFITENVLSLKTAATDNQVFLQIFGEKEESKKLEIKFQELNEEPCGERKKHRGLIETEDIKLSIKLFHANDIKLSIKLFHVNEGNGLCKWYLGSIILNKGKDTMNFQCNPWIERQSGEMTIEMESNSSEGSGNCKMDFIPSDGSMDASMSHGLRSISTLKEGLDEGRFSTLKEGSAAFKVLCRAEEILNSQKFLEKKEKSQQYLLSVNLLDKHFEERMEEMAIDMAERENERVEDMMQFERAGLPPEEQKLIKKLDETNNLCYKYLREHGNMWQYDPAKVHPCMKARLYRCFDTFDKDSDGVMMIDEVLTWAERMRSVCDTDDEEVESIREALRCYFTMYGLGDDGLCRENWVEAHVTMGAAAKERVKQKDPVPMVFMANAYFDVIDEDNNGILNMQELKTMMNVFRVPEEAAYTFFEAADVNKDGSLDQQEMYKLFYRFWFGEYDSELDDIFAYKY